MKQFIPIAGIRILLWFFVLSGIVSAQDAKLPFLFEASAEGIPTTPHAHFSSRETITFLPQTPKVNVITGEYCEEECDLLVAGVEPLSINRFYNHFTGIYNPLYGHWRINPEAFMLFNFEPIQGSQTFTAIGESNSSFFLYEQPISGGFQIDAAKNRSFTNLSSSQSGQNHPLNTKVSYSKNHVVRSYPRSLLLPADFYWWEGKIKEGSGGERVFKTDVRQWPQVGKKWPCRRSKHPCSGEITERPLDFSALPYQAQITEERKPNGNIIRYEYEDLNASNPYVDHELPTTYLLKSIKAYSQKGIFLGSIEASHAVGYGNMRKPQQLVDGISFTGSDGRKASLSNQQRQFNTRRNYYDTVLGRVDAVGKPAQLFHYRHDGAHDYQNAPFLERVIQGESRTFETIYDLNTKKVISQSAPVGPNGEMVPIARYEYQGNHTVVWDGENNKIIYRYCTDKRITAIERYQEDALYSVEKYTWQDATGNLLSKRIEDGNGKLFSLAEYVYDKNHNVIEEKVGDGKEQHITYRTFSDDGFNLKLTESDREGLETSFRYLPGTNLLAAELIYEKGQLCKRLYHVYDAEIGSVCVKTIIDDGKGENLYDFTGVTYRKIIEISPKRQLPCIGLPEVIQEKTIDLEGHEILLRKVCYTYHSSGKVLREDHYDAGGKHRYSISNEYDSRERLVATIDPLGNRITREYDEDDNLITLTGPRSDMRKERVYDKAGRPVEEREWQTDGTILTKTVNYDKLNRPLHTTDEHDNSSRYRYDAFGRVTTIIYPDDARETKEYDILGNLTLETDARGYKTERTYDYRGNPTKIIYPDGTEEEFAYDCLGRRVSHSDKNEALTTFTYDVFDNPIETTIYSQEGQLLKRTTATFSPFNKRSETDAEGMTTCFSYDFAGRKIAERTEERLTKYGYDLLGRHCKTQKGGQLYIEEHDLLGRVIEKRTEDLEEMVCRKENYQFDAAGNKTHIITSQGSTELSYDTRGNILWKKDPLGNITTTSYDYRRELAITTTNPKGVKTITVHNWKGKVKTKRVKNPQDQEIHFELRTYDRSGNQSSIKEKIYHGTSYSHTIANRWQYGPMNRLENVLESEVKNTSYTYDEKGRLQTITKPDETLIHHCYDTLGRLSRYYSDDIDYRYTYDSNDRLLSIYDTVSDTTTSRSYDVYGNLVEEKLANDLVFANNYDPYGKRTALTLPDGREIHYTYRGEDLLHVNFEDKIFTYEERDLEGNPLRISLPGSLGEITIQRDKVGRWKEYTAPGYRAYFPDDGYDSIGNLCRYTFVDSFGEKGTEYAYDDLNQLLEENDHSYAYDSLGNRLRKDQKTCIVNTLCQITEDGEKSYTYDANGNLISDEVSTYGYDSLDRLIKITKGSDTWTFFYDPFHRRLSERRKKDNVPPALPSVPRHYLWDGNNEIGLLVEGEGISELRILGEGFGAEIGSSLLFELSEKTCVPIHDHRGSIVALLDIENNKPVETYRYTAFGEQFMGGALSPWRFSSKRVDSATGFLFFGRRYYAPSLGRWITPDPQGFADGPNLYAYLHNSPLIYGDPYGLWSNPLAGSKSFGGFISQLTHFAFSGLEMVGQHLIPVPGIRDLVESVGRFGAGGKFFDQCAYRVNYNRVHYVPGKQVAGETSEINNGMGTPFKNALADTRKISEENGGVEFALIYHGTQGLVTDLITCVIAKMGIITPGERMTADFHQNILAKDPDHIFHAIVHSRAAARMINAAKLFKNNEGSHIDVHAFGPETIVPEGLFGSAMNYVSKLDIVPMTSPLKYAQARLSPNSNVQFLSPATHSPLQEHYLTGETYWREIVRLGNEFKKERGL